MAMPLNETSGIDAVLSELQRSREPNRQLAIPGLDRMVFIGVDLGQRGSHTAIVVLERFEVWPTDYADVLRGVGARKRYVVRQAERVSLGTPYTEVVLRVKRLVKQVIATKGPCVLVVDESGLGVPVVEMMREVSMGCRIMPFVITSGQQATAASVPRAELVTKMQMMAERDELEIADGCRHGEELQRELVHLQLSGGGGRSGESDDLALALALACWKARVR
jgi:hypothetical protein